MSIKNVPEEVSKKVPSLNQYRKDPKSAITYAFMILFFAYFGYKEYTAQTELKDKLKAFDKILDQKDIMIDDLNKRVKTLEKAVDVYIMALGGRYKDKEEPAKDLGGTK